MESSSLLASFAAAFTQDRRLLTLQLGDDDQWEGVLLPQSVEGHEAICDSFSYTVDCLSANGNLPLKNWLGLPASLTISDQNGEPVTRGGVVTSAKLAGSDGGFSRYQLVIEPAFALLKLRQTSRVFQDISVPDIVKQILSEHQANNPVFARHQSLLTQLQRHYPPRSYCLQYRQSDYDFIVRLLHEDGIAWRFEHIDGSTMQSRLVLFDDPQSLPEAQQQRVRFHRSDATEATDGLTAWASSHQIVPGQVSLQSFDYKAVTALAGSEQTALAQGKGGQAAQSTLEYYDPQSMYYAADSEQLADYARLRQQALDSQAKSFSGSGTMRGLQAGQWFELADHPAHDGDRREQRQFAVTQLHFKARNNLPGDLARQLPPSLLPAAAGSDDAPYQTSVITQRRGLPLTPAYSGTAHAKPTAPGVQTATVVGPAGEEVHTDDQGRIKIQLHWQRSQEHPEAGAAFDERSSCWVRVAMPSAGAGWGHAFIPRIGQEVIVDFIEGDVDRPVVTGVLYNGNHQPANFSGSGNLPGNKTLSGIKSKEHQGSGFGELLFDDTHGQIRTRLANEHGATQLNQGYLVHPRADGKAEPRGEGFELRTDLQGAIRAAKGLLLSAQGQNRAASAQMARDELVGQLEMALAMAQQLAQNAQKHQADETDTDKQKTLANSVKSWDGGSNVNQQGKDGGQGVLALSAPVGIAAATSGEISMAAGGNYDLVSAADSNHTVGKNLRMRIAQTLSIFVQSLGMKLIAAAGKIQIQAQSDEVEIGASKKLHLYSLEEVVLEAPKVTIRSQGAEIALGGGSIITQASGAHIQMAASHSMKGPGNASPQLPNMPQSQLQTDEQFSVVRHSGKAYEQVDHEIRDGSGAKVSVGQTNAKGASSLLTGKTIDSLKMIVKRK